jgi:DhnA family fructose-bisphosphate aldolase class Ia
MLKEAAQAINQAHQNGLLSVLWIYPRGKNIKQEKNPDLIAGAAGLGLCLGADFIKLSYPFGPGKKEATKAKEIITAAGNSGIIFSGGGKIDNKKFTELVRDQIKIAGARGCAVGRNIHQNKLEKAIKLANDLSKLI